MFTFHTCGQLTLYSRLQIRHKGACLSVKRLPRSLHLCFLDYASSRSVSSLLSPLSSERIWRFGTSFNMAAHKVLPVSRRREERGDCFLAHWEAPWEAPWVSHVISQVIADITSFNGTSQLTRTLSGRVESITVLSV